MWPDSARSNRRPTIMSIATIAVLFVAVGEVHSLKCRTTDHSNRQGEFIDLAEQCSNMTTNGGDRTMDNDYSSSQSGGSGDSTRRDTSRRNDEGMRNDEGGRRNGDGGRRSGESRRNNNREFSVARQDFGGNGGRGENGDNNNYNRGNGGDRGADGGNGYNRGNGGDRDSTSCDVQQRQYSGQGNNGMRQNNYRQGSSYYPSVDYDAKQSNSNQRPWPRRDRRHASNNSGRRIMAATGSNRLLGNNRFRNVTRNGVNQERGSILDKMDACTIHCVFNQLEMLNSNSRPDKSSIVNIMTNQIKDVELKEFLQDSIDECFDTLELDPHNNKCEFSKNFAVCMENKAQRNCDDWDENASPNRINSAQDGNNQQDKRKGY